MERLYIVRVEVDFMVVSDSQKDADYEAREIATACLLDEDPDIDVYPAGRRLAPGWERDCYPYNGDGQRTVGEYMDGEKPDGDD